MLVGMMMINKYLVPSNNFSPTVQHSTVPLSRFLTNSTLSQVSSLTRMQEMHACKYKLSTLTRIYDPGIVTVSDSPVLHVAPAPPTPHSKFPPPMISPTFLSQLHRVPIQNEHISQQTKLLH